MYFKVLDWGGDGNNAKTEEHKKVRGASKVISLDDGIVAYR